MKPIRFSTSQLPIHRENVKGFYILHCGLGCKLLCFPVTEEASASVLGVE